MRPVNGLERDALTVVATNHTPGWFEVVADGKTNAQRVFEATTRLIMSGQGLRIPTAEMVPVTLQIAKLVRNISKEDVNADSVCRCTLEEVRIVEGEVPLGIESTPQGLKNR